jgi:hypothetical protein
MTPVKQAGRLALVGLMISTLLTSAPSLSCTTMAYDIAGTTYLGKTYDWSKEFGLLHINKRGVAKASARIMPSDVSFAWTSKYGSLTFNQYGRELPNSGINERGLVVEVMVLDNQVFPRPSLTGSVNEVQWVQYILDTAATIDEARAQAEKVRISKVLVPLHYVVCDETAACAAFEYLNGTLKVYQGQEFQVRTLTNSRYMDSLKYLSNHVGFGGKKPLPEGSYGSLDRFVNASAHAASARNEYDPVTFGFEGLSKVENSQTQWQVVYDIAHRGLSYLSRSARQVKSVQIQDRFDWSCSTPVQVVDIINDYEGDITNTFRDYSSEENAALVKRSLGNSVPAFVIKIATELPDSTRCLKDSTASVPNL